MNNFKRHFCILMAFVFLSGILSVTPAVNANEASGLVLWYKFSEGSGSVVTDLSGNNNDGQLVGGVTWINGNSIELNGSDGYVQMPNGILSGLTDITVSTNVRIDVSNVNPAWIFTFGSSTDPLSTVGSKYFGLLEDSSSRFRATITTDRWVGEQNASKGSSLSKGVWKNIVVVISGNTMTLYEDGVAVATNSNTTIDPKDVEYTIANYIGKPAYLADKYLKARINDFRIYNRALSQDEINTLASAIDEINSQESVIAVREDKNRIDIGDISNVVGDLTLPVTGVFGSSISWSSDKPDIISSSGKVTRPPQGSEDAVVTLTATITKGNVSDTRAFVATVKASQPKGALDPDIVWYKFDETNNTSIITDWTGNGRNAELKNGAVRQEGVIGSGIKLDGVDDYISLPRGILSSTTDFTISTWLKQDQNSAWQRLYDFGTSNSNYLFLTTKATPSNVDSGVRFAITTSGGSGEQTITSGASKPMPQNVWTNVTVTLSGNVGILYIDGVEVARNNNITLKPRSLGTTTQNYIGKSQYSADPYLNGTVDDFRIYGRALSLEEIQSIMETRYPSMINDAINSIDLGDINAVVSNLSLPTAGKHGTVISWMSDNEAVIESDGTVHRPAEGMNNAVVTLTATVSKGSYQETKSFQVTVLAHNQEYDFNMDKETLSLGLTEVVTRDLWLPSTGKYGSAISWKSDNPSVLEDNGKVHRPSKGTGNQKVKLTATITAGSLKATKEFELTVLEEYAGYVMSYFTNGGTELSDTLHLAYSEDGLHWIPLNDNNGIVFPKTGEKHIRDPFLFRKEDGSFVLLATNNLNSTYIYAWDSDDLMNFKNERLLKMNDTNMHARAPECSYDPETGKYIIYWSGDVIYSNTTTDFMSVSYESKFFDPGYKCIDATIINANGSYYLFFKDERDSSQTNTDYKAIKVAKSDSLKPGSFSMVKPDILTDHNVEGPAVMKSFNDDKWYMYYDYYTQGGVCGCSYTTDLESGNWTKMDASEYSIPSGARHGNVIMVTQSELNALKERFTAPQYIVSAEPVTVSTPVNTQPNLPKSVKVQYDNGMTDTLSVHWETIKQEDLSKAGHSIIVKGTVYSADYKKPLIENRADPCIYKHTDGYYYFTASYMDAAHNNNQSYQYDRIILRRAATIEGLADAEEITVFTRPLVSGNQSPHVWAPEIHYINGKWYIYYTTTISSTDKWAIRPHALECSGDPMVKENWVDKGQIKKTNASDLAFNGFSLDHTVFEHNGELYMIWAQNNPNSNLYIARMSDPLTISTNAVLLATPEYTWETQGYKVNEGASVIKRNGKIFVAFSASGTDSRYCMGLLTADADSDLLDPASWTKTPYPVMASSRANGQFGPGHNSFTVSEDGVQDLLVYHARQKETFISSSYEPLYDAGRHARVQRLYWNSDGTPNFGVPAADGEAAPMTMEITATVNIIKSDWSIVQQPEYVFRDAQGNAASKMIKDGSVTISAVVKSSSTEQGTKDITMICALYDKNTGKLVKLVNNKQSVQAGGNLDISTTIDDLPGDETDLILKTYFWDKVDSMEPIFTPFIYSK